MLMDKYARSVGERNFCTLMDKYARSVGERNFCMLMDKYARSVGPIPLQSARLMVQSAIVVDCDLFIYLSYYLG